mmetsp:Transcript_9711/g.24495  ORF Transcript_9711/g.24495 Transcript_9711/m.24495 type:complete len:134 (-) Transcript_9711:359-760(-)
MLSPAELASAAVWRGVCFKSWVKSNVGGRAIASSESACGKCNFTAIAGGSLLGPAIAPWLDIELHEYEALIAGLHGWLDVAPPCFVMIEVRAGPTRNIELLLIYARLFHAVGLNVLWNLCSGPRGGTCAGRHS